MKVIAEFLKLYLDTLMEPRQIAEQFGWYAESDRRLSYIRNNCGVWQRP